MEYNQYLTSHEDNLVIEINGIRNQLIKVNIYIKEHKCYLFA
jgi:hypothetical protein